MTSLLERLHIPRFEFARRNEEDKVYSPVATYYLIALPALILTLFGLVMGFSASAVTTISATADDPSSLDGMASFYVILAYFAATLLIVPIISMGAGAARLGCSRGVDLADVGTMVAFLERCSHYTLEELEVLLGVSGALSLDGAQRHALGREGLHFVIC